MVSTKRLSRRKGRPTNGPTKNSLIGVRVDDRTKYLVEIAAQVRGITTSRLVAELMLQALEDIHLERADGGRVSVASVADQLWAGDEIDRFLELAFEFPVALTYDQHTLVRLISQVFDSLSMPFENPNDARYVVRTYWWQLNVAASARMAPTRVAAALRGDSNASAELARLRAASSQWAMAGDGVTPDELGSNQ